MSTMTRNPLSTELASRQIAAAWIASATDAGIPVPTTVEPEFVSEAGNREWDAIARSWWNATRGTGGDGYTVLARRASFEVAQGVRS